MPETADDPTVTTAHLDDPGFDRAERIHDWRNHVGERTKAIWPTFTPEQRHAVAQDAQHKANAEDWD